MIGLCREYGFFLSGSMRQDIFWWFRSTVHGECSSASHILLLVPCYITVVNDYMLAGRTLEVVQVVHVHHQKIRIYLIDRLSFKWKGIWLHRIWLSSLLAIRPSGHLNFGLSGLLAIWTSGHLDFWPSGLLAIWTSGHLAFWPFGHLAIWPSGHLAF